MPSRKALGPRVSPMQPLHSVTHVSGLDRLEMVGPNGLEPSTSSVSGKRSNQLSYGPIAYGVTSPTQTIRPPQIPVARKAHSAARVRVALSPPTGLRAYIYCGNLQLLTPCGTGCAASTI